MSYIVLQKRNQSLMKGSLLIVGMGEGLGSHLLELKDRFDHVVGISRSRLNIDDPDLTQIEGDVSKVDSSFVNNLPDDIASVIYIVSEWGESADMLIEEYDRFTNSGPRGFLNLFQLLKEAGKLRRDALIVSIGSISSQHATVRYNKSSYPINSTSKLLQKTLISKLATCNPDYKFALLTLGSFDYLGYPTIVEAVSNIHSLSKSTQFIELELLPARDIQGLT